MEKLEKYSVDKIDEGFALLQNLETKELKLVDIYLLPVVKEKDILVYQDNFYVKDDEERRKRQKLLREKLEKLKNIK